MVHERSAYVFKADVSDFYPSIKQPRVYRLFLNEFACSAPVAKLCTRLCTHEHHLALGLVTSPILADQVLRIIDNRIAGICQTTGIRYSRFVDDLTISADFDIARSGIPRLLNDILVESGFRANEDKYEFGRLSDGLTITGIRFNRRGNLDVLTGYADEIVQQLKDSEQLALGECFDLSRPYYTQASIRGRVEFVRRINYPRGNKLLRRYLTIDWQRVKSAAHLQRLVICKKQLTKKGEIPSPILA